MSAQTLNRLDSMTWKERADALHRAVSEHFSGEDDAIESTQSLAVALADGDAGLARIISSYLTRYYTFEPLASFTSPGEWMVSRGTPAVRRMWTKPETALSRRKQAAGFVDKRAHDLFMSQLDAARVKSKTREERIAVDAEEKASMLTRLEALEARVKALEESTNA